MATAIQAVVPVVLQMVAVLGIALAPLLPVVSQLFATLGVVLTNASPLITVLAGVVSELFRHSLRDCVGGNWSGWCVVGRAAVRGAAV